jgi:hypothetical protein
MYRIDKFLEYYNSLNDCGTEIEPGVWVNARPLPYYNCLGDLFTKRYWRELRQRRKDAKAVLQGKAVAVTWESE